MILLCFIVHHQIIINKLFMCLGTGGDVGVKEVVTKNTRWWSWSNLIYPIPTGVGLTLLAVLQWRRLNKQQPENEQQPIYTRNLRVNNLCLL